MKRILEIIRNIDEDLEPTMQSVFSGDNHAVVLLNTDFIDMNTIHEIEKSPFEVLGIGVSVENKIKLLVMFDIFQEACNTDCLSYRQGLCKFIDKETKKTCPRVQSVIYGIEK